MAAAIKNKFNLDSELIQGRGGIFDVKLDDELIFSKHEVGRFPTSDEIFQALDAKV